MTTIKGTYGTKITERDGEYRVTFLQNVGTELHQHATGDVVVMKTYKSEKMAQRKSADYLAGK